MQALSLWVVLQIFVGRPYIPAIESWVRRIISIVAPSRALPFLSNTFLVPKNQFLFSNEWTCFGRKSAFIFNWFWFSLTPFVINEDWIVELSSFFEFVVNKWINRDEIMHRKKWIIKHYIWSIELRLNFESAFRYII